ncbi:EAL domain-containing protein [Altererythrobacter sp. Z27]|uniref:EAL domain-containing protein n=1 Tax=Altererythrobacter sp. Z27 TaxID=3461147 RepID=UPI0040447C99
MTILRRPGSGEQQSALFERDSSELADEFELALRLGQVEIRFQPQFAGDSGRMVGAEALARWIHPSCGEIGARELFDLAAKAGLAEDMPRHMLSLAVVEAKNWPERLGLSLNVTPKQLLADSFVARFSSELAASMLDPTQVTLEITEELLLGDLDLAARRLKQLRDLGIRIALDDFGAGFCNFDYLKRLPLDALKLDRSMVLGIAESERDLAVLRAIVTLARVLDLDVVAEGIETEEQRLAVVAEGCSSWQGFLGSEPLAYEELLQLA